MKPQLLILFLSLCAFAQAQTQAEGQAQPAARRSATVRYQPPMDADLAVESAQVDYFRTELKMLKTEFESKNPSGIVLHERNLVELMRFETQSMEDKVEGEKVQRERRKQNPPSSDGNAAQAGETARPQRDPFADPETPSEQRLEQMRLTLGLFDRHAFDPGNPDQAKRDFAKLDAFLQILEADLADLKRIKG